MSFVRNWFLMAVVGLVTVGLTSGSLVLAQELVLPPSLGGPSTEKTDEPDPFVVPEGGAAEMVTYLEKLENLMPNPRQDRRAFFRFLAQSAKPTLEASDRILNDKEATKDQKVIAAKAKFRALSVLSSLGDPKAIDAMQPFTEQLTKLGLKDLAWLAKSQLVSADFGKIVQKMPGAPPLDKVIGNVKALVVEMPDKNSFQLAFQTIRLLQILNKTPEASKLCKALTAIYTKSKSPDAKLLAEKFKAIGRRMELPGHPMKVEGKYFDGKPFDWKTYKGKVVLVQFWATWCNYCLKEMPNIRKCYKEYHDRGFDIVSICLDKEKMDLDAYLEDHSFPWPLLYEKGGQNATAEYYGVTGLPTMILVGSDGNVVSLNAQGELLRKDLEKLLGPPSPKPEKKEEKKLQQ